MRKIDVDKVRALQSSLDALPARHTATPYEVIAELAETISRVRSRGYDIDHIVELLATAGIVLSRRTVRNYLTKARKTAHARNRSSSAPVSASVAAPPSDTSPREGHGAARAAADESTASRSEHPRGARLLDLARDRARLLREASSTHKPAPAPGTFDLDALSDTDLISQQGDQK